jgi:tRNA (Thr-GGU) A37 N-methylase
MLTESLTLTPIAYVKSLFRVNTPAEEMRRHRSQLVVEPEYRPGLMGSYIRGTIPTIH